MKRHALTDEQWSLIEPLLPRHTACTGRKPRDRRTLLNGLLWIVHTGAPWRDLPERFGPWQTVYHHFVLWRRSGILPRLLRTLQVRLERQGLIDWNLWCIDSTSVRGSRAAAGAGKKVCGGMPTSRRITRWAAAAADLEAKSTWLLTAEALR